MSLDAVPLSRYHQAITLVENAVDARRTAAIMTNILAAVVARDVAVLAGADRLTLERLGQRFIDAQNAAHDLFEEWKEKAELWDRAHVEAKSLALAGELR